MSYLYRPHECDLPRPDVHGAVWACEDGKCRKVWRASVPGNPNYAGWRRLGPIGRLWFGVERAERSS